MLPLLIRKQPTSVLRVEGQPDSHTAFKAACIATKTWKTRAGDEVEQWSVC